MLTRERARRVWEMQWCTQISLTYGQLRPIGTRIAPAEEGEQQPWQLLQHRGLWEIEVSLHRRQLQEGGPVRGAVGWGEHDLGKGENKGFISTHSMELCCALVEMNAIDAKWWLASHLGCTARWYPADKSTIQSLRSVLAWATSGDGEGCLLYTSPSPRDRTRSRMPSSA